MKKYAVIYADPPWRYKMYKGNGKIEKHYPTMELDEIKALPVKKLADKDCILFLWATLPMIPEALQVIKAWGFEYKTTAFVWVKLSRHSDGIFWGMGHQVIVSHVEEHSKKPAEARRRIEALIGDVPRIELFARQSPPGWDVWGNEVVSDITMDKLVSP